MLLARYAPVGSQRFEKLALSVKSLDGIIEWLPAHLFGIWSIFVAGMVSGKAQVDRFYFWDWSDWWKGLLGLLVIAIIYKPLKIKLKIKDIDNINWIKNSKSALLYVLVGVILFIIGWFIVNTISFNKVYYSISFYSAFFLGILLIHPIKNNEQNITDITQKNIQTGFGIFFLIGALLLGYMFDDPVIATASIVSLPFLIVLLFGKHVRHLERAKFYPIFVFAMFVTSREGWFLIPLLLLFFILRSYNYLRYQKVYPTFGVTNDQS